MALIGPLFLLGLLGIGLPIWLHRLETQVTEREQFSTTRFMEPAKKRIHVQRKLKYLLLMALRIAFFVLLVLAFTRPVLFTSPDVTVTEDTTHHVIVMDTSFSMSADGSFDSALDQARDIINGMGSDDVASLYSASTGVTTIVPVTDNAADLLQGLDSLSPGNGKLDLGAMVTALNTLIEQSQANFILHVVSDFQQSGQAVRFADMIPDVINGRPVSLDLVRVTTSDRANWAIDSVIVEDRANVVVGVRAYGVDADTSNPATLTLLVNGEPAGEQAIIRNSEQLVFYTFENIIFAEGDNRLDLSLSPNDNLAGDDVRHAVFDNSPPAPVLLLTSDPESLGVTYITAALETAPRGYAVIPQDIGDLDTRTLQRYPWIVIEDIGAINPSLADGITDYINDGGSVFAAAGDLARGLSAVPVLDLAIGNTAVRREGRAPITMIDSSHPALAESAGWGSVNVQGLPIEAGDDDRLLIAQGGDRPVLLERAIGRGRLMLLTAALDNSSSDLPVKPVFVSFMAEAARYLSNENLLTREQAAESFLQLGQAGGASGQVFDPDGESLLSLSDTTRAQDIALNKTGFYQVFTPAGEVLVAVNPDRRESDLTVMDVEVLQNWQNVVAGASSASTSSNTESVVDNNNDAEETEIWRIFLVLLALIVLAECVLGNQHLRVRTGTM